MEQQRINSWPDRIKRLEDRRQNLEKQGADTFKLQEIIFNVEGAGRLIGIDFDQTMAICNKLQSKMPRALRTTKVVEKVPMFYVHLGWPPEPFYQPINLSWIVSYAFFNKKTFDDVVAENDRVNELAKREYKKLEMKLKNLRKYNIDPFIKGNLSSIAGNYFSAMNQKDQAQFKKKQLLKSTTKPQMKYFDLFCRDTIALIKKRSGRPQYRLIADIANLCKLTSNRQTENSIRKRVSRLK